MALRWPTLRETVGGIGGALLAIGLVVVFVPDVLPPVVLEVSNALPETVAAWQLVLVLAVVVFVYALVRFVRTDPGTVERLVDTDESVGVPDVDADDVEFDPSRPGRSFDHAMTRTVAALERQPNADPWDSSRVRETLEEAVVAVRTNADRDADVVAEEVADGSWTDDDVAAAFLGGRDAPGVSVWRRLYAWLYPARAYERRVERVVAEIERQGSVEVGELTGTEVEELSTEDEDGAASGDRSDGDPDSSDGSDEVVA